MKNSPAQSAAEEQSNSPWLDSAGVRPQADQRLQRLNRLATLGVLSASAAHEIKNALVPIKTFIDLLIEREPDSELAGIVRHEIERVNTLLSQMLKLSRPADPQMLPLSLHKAVQDSLKLVARQAGAKNVTVEFRLEASADLVLGDADQLEQVFLNLFINAFEAMGENGVLVVTTSNNEENSIQVAVRDNGGGISTTDLDGLFRPFFTTKEGGTGLGLSIAKEIVAAHKGTMTVQSKLGQGATFTVRLPLTNPVHL